MNPKCMEYLKRFPTLEGKHILITGSTSGIGLEAAKDFLYLGATVHFMVRNEAKAKDCIASIESELGHPISTFIHLYDQSNPSSIKACVDGLKGLHLDVIVLNAGVYFPKIGASANGHPLTLQVNAIGTHYCFDCFYALFPDARYVIIDSIAVANPKRTIICRILSVSMNQDGNNIAFPSASRCTSINLPLSKARTSIWRILGSPKPTSSNRPRLGSSALLKRCSPGRLIQPGKPLYARWKQASAKAKMALISFLAGHGKSLVILEKPKSN